MLTTDELIRIQREVMSGFAWGDPRSKVAPTPEAHEAWDAVAADIAAMKAKGIVPEIPFEIGIDEPAQA